MSAAQNKSIVEPYLFFEGCCEEAVEFYRRALGAEVNMMMRYKDSPHQHETGCDTSVPGDKIMHASIRIGQTQLMASDGRCTGKREFAGFSLSINVPTIEEAEKQFAALSEGGKVMMPMAKTFFATRFGMVTDRFGVAWMVVAHPET